jgi:aryl-alcohol dehydrogenase-like predicted oxidoreductase
MQTSTLGRTGLKISRLSLGGLFVNASPGSLDEAKRAVARAVELGINYIDTAPTYGQSEEVLGQVFKDVKGPFVISTKLGGKPDPFKPQDKACLMASVENSLKLLGRDHIDILMVHEPDRVQQYNWWTDWDAVNGPVLEVLEDLKRKGVISHTGLGGTTTAQMGHLCRSGKFDVVLTAYQYSLLYREAATEVIPVAKAAGMGVVVGSPLQQGALSRKHPAATDASTTWLSSARREQFRQLYALVDECGISLPELGTRFVLSNPQVDTVLMGVSNAAELNANVSAAEKGPLPADLARRIDQIAALVPFRPYGEPFGLGWILPWPGSFKGLAGA